MREGKGPWLASGALFTAAGLFLCSRCRRESGTPVDRKVLRAFRHVRSKPLTMAARAVDKIASPTGLALTAAGASRFAPPGPAREKLLAGPVLRVVLENLLKRLFPRSRPPLIEQIGHRVGRSLPSGHSMSGVEYLLVAATFAPGPAGIAAAGIAAALIGATRIYLAAHRPTDVAAGFLLGLGTAALLEGMTPDA